MLPTACHLFRNRLALSINSRKIITGSCNHGSKFKVGQVGKHKFAKLNPQINKSVMQILKEVDEQERGIANKKQRKMKKDRLHILSKQGGTLHSAALDRASSIEALQQTLRAKVEIMNKGRDLEKIRARRELQKLKHQKNKKKSGNKIKRKCSKNAYIFSPLVASSKVHAVPSSNACIGGVGVKLKTRLVGYKINGR